MLSAIFCSGSGAASGSHFVVEAVGDVSEDEEHWGGYQKDRMDDADDSNDIWSMDDHMAFSRDGEGNLDDEDLDPDNVAHDDSEKS